MIVALTEEDLVKLSVLYPELDFADPYRNAALLHASTVDIQAAPGSGKTTLLGAKLALVAEKWPHATRGICVLSHTNVAREEIEARLLASPAGDRLLTYPHFVGTIQSFVHTFLSLPSLRSLGVEVNIVDDDTYADRAKLWAERIPILQAWAKKSPHQRLSIIESLRFQGPDCSLNSPGGKIPSESTKTYKALESMKVALCKQGVLRFDDMFSIAERLLTKWPDVADAIAARFPVVFIDEMQDTNAMQERLLTLIFRDKSIVQRYGDINQSILNISPEKSTFPRPGFLSLPSSKRFGTKFSEVANSLRHAGTEIFGEGVMPACPVTLLLYSDATIQRVLPVFASLIADAFTNDELGTGNVKALCARKQGGKSKTTGSNISEYWPGYNSSAGRPVASRRSVCDLVRLAGTIRDGEFGRQAKVTAARMAILRCLKLGGAPVAESATNWLKLLDNCATGELDAMPLHRLVHKIITSPPSMLDEREWESFVEVAFQHLTDFLPTSLTFTHFAVLEELAFIPEVAGPAGSTQDNIISCTHGAQSVDIHLSTTASAKGETHLATLVMESFHNPKFDFQSALPFLCDEASATTVTDLILRRHLLNLFVAATRPRRMLCFAAHTNRVGGEYAAKLQAKGWEVKEL